MKSIRIILFITLLVITFGITHRGNYTISGSTIPYIQIDYPEIVKDTTQIILHKRDTTPYKGNYIDLNEAP